MCWAHLLFPRADPQPHKGTCPGIVHQAHQALQLHFEGLERLQLLGQGCLQGLNLDPFDGHGAGDAHMQG